MTLVDDIYTTKPLSLVSKAIESVTSIGIIYEKRNIEESLCVPIVKVIVDLSLYEWHTPFSSVSFSILTVSQESGSSFHEK